MVCFVNSRIQVNLLIIHPHLCSFVVSILKSMPKILLVEDNEMNRDMLSRRLQRKGFEIVMAADGQSGVETAHSEAPDLILMDMSLPVVDGWEATRQLKADAVLRRIPVIALTAHAMSSDRDKALEAGCDDYDTKPVELPRLLQKIEALLSAGSHSAAAHSAGSHSDVFPDAGEAVGAGSAT